MALARCPALYVYQVARNQVVGNGDSADHPELGVDTLRTTAFEQRNDLCVSTCPMALARCR
jgi:hypothetical protein